jgi:alpha-tubulin suppressor-like RCC1 family protein
MRSELSLLVLAACNFPGAAGPFSCDPDGTCAAGHVCVEQVCVPERSTCAKGVTAGDRHACAIRDDGTAWCWGRNDFGQLGDGTTEDRTSPVQVSGANLPRFAAIAAGADHTCARAEDGSVWCWGSNKDRQLGLAFSGSDLPPVLTPAQVSGLSGAKQIAVGRAHSCALLGGGNVSCWGAYNAGQIGSDRGTPATVQNLGATEIAAGGDTTCAIVESDGGHALSCWGSNFYGQFGDDGMAGGPQPSHHPLPGPAQPAPHVALGADFVCVSTSSGTVSCAGANGNGQLGDSSTGLSKTLLEVQLPVLANTITAGAHFACATERSDDLHGESRLWCWGDDGNSQLADGASGSHATPTLTSYTNVAAAAAGAGHLCVLSAAGGITCSGDHAWGQLGDGNRTTQPTPPPAIPGLSEVTSIAAGGAHSCAIRNDGTAWCWGRNDFGQLGDGSLSDRSRPTRVEGIDHAIAIATGVDYSCAVLAARTAMCWGHNNSDQLGAKVGSFSAVPAPVMDGDVELSGITQLVAAGAHICALIDGQVKCWGYNAYGQTGVSPEDGNVPSPTLVVLGPEEAPLREVVEIALGFNHTCALLGNQTVSCWGANSGGGQLGTGDEASIISRFTPKAVAGLANVQHIASRGDFTCAIVGDGSVRCWGRGQEGEIGDGGGHNQSPPGPLVNGISGATKIVSGAGHACVVANTGLACWGSNDAGQVGTGSYDSAIRQPAPVLLGGAVKQLAGGDRHTCALLDDGTVSCWGDDHVGQLGDGAFDKRSRVAPLLPCP